MKPRVLHVEDDPDDAALAQLALGALLSAYEWIVVRDGEAALRYLLSEASAPALILLDLNLPRLSGIELLERLRAEWNGLRGARVIVLSSSAETLARDRAYALGAELCLRKPENNEESEAMVRRVARLLG